MVKGLPGQILANSKYNVRFAKTNTDLRSAQSLRYRVFNLELGEGLASSHEDGLDSDKYDSQCDHLLVVERESDKVIGTYRMQTFEKARKHHGFYTENEFQIYKLPDEILNNSVELGRACIAKEHRNGRVLYLLWKGIAEYMKSTSNRYLFGCSSLTSTRPRDGWVVLDYLRNKGFMHDDFYLDTTDAFDCPQVERNEEAWKSVKLPTLFRLYMDLGAKTLSEPALDKNFKTIDFLIIVDIKELDERTRILFFR